MLISLFVTGISRMSVWEAWNCYFFGERENALGLCIRTSLVVCLSIVVGSALLSKDLQSYLDFGTLFHVGSSFCLAPPLWALIPLAE